MNADEPATRKILESLLADSPFQQLLGLRLDAFDLAAQTVTIRSIYGPNVERSSGTGQYHGGVIATFIDVAGDFALALVVGGPVPTINLRVDYLRPATRTALTATARVRRAGRTVGVVDVDVHDDSGKLVAVGRGCYSAIPG